MNKKYKASQVVSLLVFVYLFTVYLVLLLAVAIVLNDRMISEECIGSYREGSDDGMNCGVS